MSSTTRKYFLAAISVYPDQKDEWKSLFTGLEIKFCFFPNLELALKSHMGFQGFVVFSHLGYYTSEIERYRAQLNKILYLQLGMFDKAPKPTSSVKVLQLGAITPPNVAQALFQLGILSTNDLRH